MHIEHQPEIIDLQRQSIAPVNALETPEQHPVNPEGLGPVGLTRRIGLEYHSIQYLRPRTGTKGISDRIISPGAERCPQSRQGSRPVVKKSSPAGFFPAWPKAE